MYEGQHSIIVGHTWVPFSSRLCETSGVLSLLHFISYPFSFEVLATYYIETSVPPLSPAILVVSTYRFVTDTR